MKLSGMVGGMQAEGLGSRHCLSKSGGTSHLKCRSMLEVHTLYHCACDKSRFTEHVQWRCSPIYMGVVELLGHILITNYKRI